VPLFLQHDFAYVAVKVAEFLREVFAVNMSLSYDRLLSHPGPVFDCGMNVPKLRHVADPWDLLR
jgi:hypothetical protein